ncbi:MAG: hypothetical protein ACRDNW_22995 [Trebonia sp.]
MSNPSARHQLVCAAVQRHPESVAALAEAVGVPLPDHDEVAPVPDSHQMQDGNVIYTDATVRLLREGRPVFFATVEMQRKFAGEKYATLHAYHGSGVRNAGAGGHLFVLSERAAVSERFRVEDAARRAELAFAASFHSGRDLVPLEDGRLPLGARVLPAALADFRADPPRAQAMLDELRDSDLTLANLYLRAIVEEVPMTMLGEVLQPDMLDKLRGLEWFREYEVKVKAEADAEAAAKVKEADAKADAAATSRHLKEFLVLRGDAPSKHALNSISACQDADVLEAWLKRAYLGETSAQLFPEPKSPAS